MTKKKLEKPTKTSHEPTWEYDQVINYLEEKYNFNTRGYTPTTGFTEEIKEEYYKKYPGRRGWGGEEKIYLDFWHWLLENSFSELNNGSYNYLPVKEYLEDKETPSWVKEILQKMFDEFQEDEMEFWVAW